MYTKKYLSSYSVGNTVKKGCDVARNGQRYVTLLICSSQMQDRGVRVVSFNPKDIAKCSDGEGHWLPNETIDGFPEETVDNFDKVVVDLDGIYNRIDNGNIVIDEKTNRPAEYTSVKVGVMWTEKWDYLFVDGKPFINPVTGAFDRYPINDPATGRPKRFYDQGWSPEERIASLIEAGFYVKATTASSATSTSAATPPAPKTPEQIAAEAKLEAAQAAAQAAQQPNPGVA